MKPSPTPSLPSRRRFLGLMGLASLGLATGCTPKERATTVPAHGSMTYRINPSTGDSVSLLGYGCMRLPTLRNTTGADDDSIDQEAVNRSVDAALAGGVNYFDTSPAYCQGLSEKAMGIALARHPRQSYFIATKLSNFAPQTHSMQAGKDMFEASLANLQTTYVDYLLLHAIGGGGMDAYNARYGHNGLLDWLIEQKRLGRIRNLGFSYHGDVAVFDHLLTLMDQGKVHWDFVQIQLNYLDWLHAKETNPRNTDAEYLYGELSRRGIPAVIMEPLLGGRLAKVPAAIQGRMRQLRPADSPAAWAMRFAGTPAGVLTVLSGMTYMEHLAENIATFSPLQPLDDTEKQFLETAALEILANHHIPCTGCQYCMPCPYGVDIPAVFAHYNKCIDDDKAPRDRRDPGYDRRRRAYLADLGRHVAPGRGADRCIACGKCTHHCPQNIDIPAQLAQIDKYTKNLKI